MLPDQAPRYEAQARRHRRNSARFDVQRREPDRILMLRDSMVAVSPDLGATAADESPTTATADTRLTTEEADPSESSEFSELDFDE